MSPATFRWLKRPSSGRVQGRFERLTFKAPGFAGGYLLFPPVTVPVYLVMRRRDIAPRPAAFHWPITAGVLLTLAAPFYIPLTTGDIENPSPLGTVLALLVFAAALVAFDNRRLPAALLMGGIGLLILVLCSMLALGGVLAVSPGMATVGGVLTLAALFFLGSAYRVRKAADAGAEIDNPLL